MKKKFVAIVNTLMHWGEVALVPFLLTVICFLLGWVLGHLTPIVLACVMAGVGLATGVSASFLAKSLSVRKKQYFKIDDNGDVVWPWQD